MKKDAAKLKKDLKPIKAVSLTDQVERSLITYLKQNDFKAGDSLPKELELASYLGVSRNIVREALSRLRMLGIVKSKKRKGMIYGEPDVLGGISKIMDPDLLGTKAMKDLFELRLVLETGMSDLLYARLRPEDVVELEDIARREAEDPDCRQISTRLGYEVEFHGKLYEMSGNATLARFQSMLLPVFNYMMEVESHLEKEPKRGEINHFDLIETLKYGNAAKFREDMREHLTPHYERLHD